MKHGAWDKRLICFGGRVTLNIHARGWGEEEDHEEVTKLFSHYNRPGNGVAAEGRDAVPQGKHVAPGAGKHLESMFWIICNLTQNQLLQKTTKRFPLVHFCIQIYTNTDSTFSAY